MFLLEWSSKLDKIKDQYCVDFFKDFFRIFKVSTVIILETRKKWQPRTNKGQEIKYLVSWIIGDYKIRKKV